MSALHAPPTSAPDSSSHGGRADLFAYVLDNAQVPEHSPAFMCAMSGGNLFIRGDYCFLTAQDWLMALGYPLRGAYSPETFTAALGTALDQTSARDCWCIAPELPLRLLPHQVDADDFFILPASAVVPARLRRPLARARACLRVDLTTRFSPQHRRLWSEFMARTPLKANERELFARTEQVMGTPGLMLLNAWDEENRLAACLLLDFAPKPFVSYLIGAHSRSPYTPYASDLLIATLLAEARKCGKEYIHLGLGVHEGLRRFKCKWGAVPALPYRMAAWKEQPPVTPEAAIGDMVCALTADPTAMFSARDVLGFEPLQRPFAMLWEVEKEGKRSWIGGSAHFFRYSFARSFRRLFKQVDTILLEGPLDEKSLDGAAHSGRTPSPDVERVASLLTEDEIRVLMRVVRGPEGFLARQAGCAVSSTSCGLHINEDIACRVVESGMDVLAFSLAGTDEASNAIRQGAPFAKVCEHVRLMAQARKKAGAAHLSLYCAYMLLADRMEAVLALPDLAAGLGLQAAVVSTLDYLAAPGQEHLAFAPHEADKIARAQDLLAKAAARAAKLGLGFHYGLLGPEAWRTCREQVERSLYVDADGALSPCIYVNVPVQDNDARRRVFGNANETDAFACWQGERFTAFRKALETGRPDLPCVHCAKRFEKMAY
ncbi:MAG: SPASM domain-containing protein [Desulfobulbus sp.]|nr:SPASM domain-containing protein [Desulfobulbus sp.]